MGSKSSSMLGDAEIQQISEQTGFLPSQIEKLYTRFTHLNRSSDGFISRSDLMSIPELAYNPLCDRIVHMFFADCNNEEDRIDFRQFMLVLANFQAAKSTNNNNDKLPRVSRNDSKNTQVSSHRGSNGNDVPKLRSSRGLREKLLFVFKVYDVDNDGLISFNDLRNILKMMVGNHIEELQLDKIATRAFVEVDVNSDGFIEFLEFCKIFSGKNFDDMLRVNFW